MLSLLAYLIVIALTIFCALSLCILCFAIIVQPTSATLSSDMDSSEGMKSRKWLLHFIGQASALRCLSATLEFIIFAINIVKEDKPTSSISYYDGFTGTAPRLLFSGRFIPTLLFLAYYALIGDYFARLSFSIRENDYKNARRCFMAVSGAAGVAMLYFVTVDSDPFLLNAVYLAVLLFYIAWIVWHVRGINQFYVSNEDVLMESSSTNQGKLLARLLRVAALSTAALLVPALACCVDISSVWPESAFYAHSAGTLSAVLFSEVLCAWVMVSLLSNRLVPFEGKLRKFCGQRVLPLLWGGGASAAGGQDPGGAATAAGPGAASLLPSPARRTSAELKEQQQLQQQQLLKRYSNYQSIPLGEDADALP